jgi:hypothetical protein
MRHTRSIQIFSLGSSGSARTSKILLLSVLVFVNLESINGQVGKVPICPNLAEFGIKG